MILLLDEHLVVVNKPSGLPVHRGVAKDEDVALTRVRALTGGLVYPAHRLDRGTSGALLFARSKEMAGALGRLFEEGLIQKKYLALVRGRPPATGSVDHPIPRTEDGDRVPAVTRFRVLGTSPVDRCALVEAMPETGRWHQVRRHMKHISHPIVGDVKHGKGDINRHYRTTYGLQRLALHASFLGFRHPTTRLPVSVFAPVPDDLAEPLRMLQLDPLSRGLRCFEAGEYFEAHEIWEDEWRASKLPYWQGLIQVAAGLHKLLSMRAPEPAERLLRKAATKLEGELRDEVGRCADAIAADRFSSAGLSAVIRRSSPGVRPSTDNL
jgi:tRNA pseudouridine65 synthase